MATVAEKIVKPATTALQQKTSSVQLKQTVHQPFFGGVKTGGFFSPSVKPKLQPVSNLTGGSAMPSEAREYFKSSLNADVSDIRVHNDMESLLATRARGVRAFAQGEHISFDPSAYSPASEDGGVLLARMVSQSLKQRSVDVPDLDQQLSAGIADVSKAETPPVPKAKEVKQQDEDGPKKKKGAGNKEKVGKKDKAAKQGRGKKGKGAGDGPAFPAKKKDPKKAPASPQEDPAFHKSVKKTKATAKKEKVHEPAEVKSAAAQKSAKAVPKEAESKAKNRKTDGLDNAGKEDRPFDAVSFKNDLLKKITEITPSTLKQATEFKESNKIDSVKQAMGGKVAEQKEASTGPVDKAAAQPLSIQESDNKTAVPLPPLMKPVKPGAPSAKDAAPKPKTPGEISLKEQSNSLDAEMKANNVTEDQLIKSNEPSFASALDSKKSAQKDAAQRPVDYKKKEGILLEEARSSAGAESSKVMGGIQLEKTKNQNQVGQHQQTAKEKDEERRATVAKTIDDLYKSAETKVNSSLELADKDANSIFDTGSETARISFENYVGERMAAYKRRRYSGFWGKLRWVKDKLLGMPDEVNGFYSEGRKLYLDQMDKVITRVAAAVTARLNEAKQAIKEGKKSIDQYVNSLPSDLADVGKEAASDIQDKFDTLEQNINDKRDALIDGLAKKYVDNVKKLDDRISEMKEANKGLVDKAIGFLKKVWAVIKSLKDLFTTILSKLASIIGTILSSPSKFFSNLGRAFQQGFDNFKANFTGYLEKGLMDWLATNLGVSGIELPDKFTPGAMFTLALQIMGITKVKIRKRAVELLDEDKVALLEGAGGFIHKIYNEGPASIWDMIVEKLSDFKEIVWEAIKSFIKKSIIDAALIFLLSMLNPIGAFIKVCMAIYDFLMMLVKFKDKIIELLDTVLNAVTSIASGAVDSAAKAIEKAFAKSIPVIIAFLAALLHLNNIADKVRNIVTRIQNRVEKAIDFVIMKGWSVIGKGVEGVLRVKNKGMEMVEKGKGIVVGAGQKVVGAVAGWLGFKKHFKLANGEDHEIYFAGHSASPEVMIASEKGTSIERKIAERRALSARAPAESPKQLTADQHTNLTQAIALKVQLDQFIAANTGPAPGGGGSTRNIDGEISRRLDLIKTHLVAGDVIPVATSSQLPLSNITYTMSSGRATEVRAEPLTRLPGNTRGTDPQEDPLGWEYITMLDPANFRGWVRAHLVNENLHGPGRCWNLVPGSQRMNTAMKYGIEKWAKNEVADGQIIFYHAAVTGWYHRDNPLIQNYFPTGIEVTRGYMPGSSKGGDTRMFIDKKYYQADDPIKLGPPNINHMTKTQIKAVFRDVRRNDLIFSSRNLAGGSEFKSLIHMRFRLKEAYNDSADFETTIWPAISRKFNHENLFIF